MLIKRPLHSKRAQKRNLTGVRPGGLDMLEARLFLSAAPRSAPPRAAAAAPPALVAPTPPKVTQVYVANTDWSPTFKAQLQADGRGSALYGAAIPGGPTQLVPLAWVGLNQVSITFDQNVAVVKDDLHIHGINVPNYALGTFAYNAVTRTATWTLDNNQRFDIDQVLLDLNGEEGTVVYDSGGFEQPRFAPGKLEFSDGTNPSGPWLHASESGSGVVQNSVAQSGSQAVKIDRTGFDERWTVRKPVTSPLTPVSVQWDEYVEPASLPSGSFGPYFAMEVYDDLGNPPRLAGSAGVDAATGEVLYQAAGTGFLTTTGQTVTMNAWHHFEMVLNYVTHQYTVKVDNVTVASNIGFVDAGVNDFTDADIAALAAGGDPASQKAHGVGYYDNYKVVDATTNTAYYDSGGFEFPRYTRSSLEGSDPANGPWVYSGPNGYGLIENGIAAGGSQAVGIVRNRADERWGVKAPVANPPGVIDVSWDQYVQPTSLPSGSFGPYFAIEAYDELGNPPRLAGSAGVDAATGEVLYQAAGTGFITSTNQTVSLNAWHHFQMVLNYTNDTYTVYVDGAPVAQNIGFVDAGVDDFTDADIAALAAGADAASQNAGGTAFFDNYRITQRPVPVNAAGQDLDGEWFNGASQYPSGNGAAGGAFRFEVNVLPADFNGSGTVDFEDLVILAQHYLQPSSYPEQGDATADGMTDFSDLVVLAQHYNKSLPSAYPLGASSLTTATAQSQSVFSTQPIKKTSSTRSTLFRPTTTQTRPAASKPVVAKRPRPGAAARYRSPAPALRAELV